MIYVGIDVAKAKHDCCILSSDGSALREPFTFANDQGGFDLLMASIVAALQEAGSSQIKAGLKQPVITARTLWLSSVAAESSRWS
ncbi:MAG: IS110 family transposase [Saccharofermentanales bacterium]